MRRSTGKYAVEKSWAMLLTSVAVGLAVLAGLSLAGLTQSAERILNQVKAELTERDASGDLVLIEIDAQSLQKFDQWPWPRSLYGRGIDQLNKAGVAKIGMDIDFSSTSIPAEDAAFAAALERSNAPVILPTFRQRTFAGSDEFLENLPIKALRDRAFVASVNVHPDENGQITSYSYGTVTQGVARPSLAAMLAGTSGEIGGQFPIDQRIDPNSMPRISFADLVEGRFDPDLLAGKSALIGGTAIELGDRYAMGRHGVITGVMVQALAADTLISNATMPHVAGWPLLFVAVIIALVTAWRWPSLANHPLVIVAGSGGALFFIAVGLYHANIVQIATAPAMLFLTAFAFALKITSLGRSLQFNRLHNAESNLPNRSAMQERNASPGDPMFAVALISNYEDVSMLVEPQHRPEIWSETARRLAMLADNGEVFHLGTNSVGWFVRPDYHAALDDHFDTAASLFRPPILIGGRQIQLSAFFGVDVNDLESAEIAAKQAHSAGLRWTTMDDAKRQTAMAEQQLLSELSDAMEQEQFAVYYQPKMDMRSGQIKSAEALIRWDHPISGRIGADSFIPLFERSGRISELSLYTIRRCLRDMASWRADGADMSVAINISAPLLLNEEFIVRALAIVGDAQLGKDELTFEITESAALNDADFANRTLNRLADAGIRISIDDYGTGQSTLSYLKQFPAQEIKIDQCFVRTMVSSPSDQAMVRSTIDLAHSLGFKVVGEGVEDAATFDMLAQYGCDVAQGWHIGKPMPQDEFADFIGLTSPPQRLSA